MSSSRASAVATSARRAADGHPAELHLRQPGRFRQAAERERQRGLVAADRDRVLRAARADSRRRLRRRSARSLARARVGEPDEVVAAQHRSRRIVRADDEDGADVRRQRVVETRAVDRPRVVFEQTIRTQRHGFESGQQLEQRVARLRDEHRVTGIAEQLEQQRVRLARAGGDDDAIGRDDAAATGVVARDRLVERRRGPAVQARNDGRARRPAARGRRRDSRVRQRSGSSRSGRARRRRRPGGRRWRGSARSVRSTPTAATKTCDVQHSCSAAGL